jgi:K+-sensing histidine kinase KdpD
MTIKLVDEIPAAHTSASSGQDIDFNWVMESTVYGIKNSLAVLQCLLEQEQVSDAINSEKSPQQINIIQRETSRIDNDSTQLLALYRMHNQQLSLRIDEVDIYYFLEEAVIANQLLADSNNTALSFECEEDLMGYFDPSLIRSVLHAAIVGGVQYAKSSLKITARSEDDRVVISVLDDGAGFPETLRTQYANQKPLDHTSEQVRANMNFYFASCVAHQHQNAGQEGFIHLENNIEGGGCFEIHLP